MKLASIEIRNFKGLKAAKFEPGEFSCLVGENNAGKSSVLQAIVSSINRQPTLSLALFYDQSQPVEFIWKFSEVEESDLNRLQEDHREKIAGVVSDGSIVFCSRYRPEEKLELRVIIKTPRDERLKRDRIDEVLKGKRGAAITQAVGTILQGRSIEIPQFTSVGAAKSFIQEQISNLPADEMELSEAPLPSGITTSLGNFLPEPIYIPAVKNLGDDLKTSQSTSFGKLISLLLSDLAPDLEQFERSFTELRGLLNRSRDGGADGRHDKVKHLEKRIEENLAANFPKLKVELEIPPPELKAVLSSAQLYVDDGSRDLIENKGDGVKRSLTFSILKTYVDEMEIRSRDALNNPISRPILLLFEEPELYLHPKSQKILFLALSKIAFDHQVIVTTHSPLFFAPSVTASFVRVAKESAEPKPVGKLYPVNFSLEPNRASMFKLARYENADAAFFSRRVVLFEGDSDEHFIKHVSRLINELWNFDSANISLVPVNGKGNFKKYRDFFQAFNIEVFVVADLDVIFEGFEHLGASDAASTLRNTCIQNLDRFIAANPTLVNEPSGKQISKRVKSPTFKERYLGLKREVELLREGAPVPLALKNQLENLFGWEAPHKRMDAVQQSVEAFTEIEPLIRQLFAEDIFVLRKGAIEDYYPPGVEKAQPKPQRALRAVELLPDREALRPLTSYQSGGNSHCEFEEALAIIFTDQD